MRYRIASISPLVWKACRRLMSVEMARSAVLMTTLFSPELMSRSFS